MKTTHEPLHLDKRSLVQWKIMNYLSNYFLWQRLWIWRWWDFQTFYVYVKLALFNMGLWNFVCRQIFKWWTASNETTFAKDEKYEHGGWFNVKIHILCFMETSHEALHLGKGSFFTVKDHGYTWKFYYISLISVAELWIWQWFEMLKIYCDELWSMWDFKFSRRRV
jgi:hypothetical protein